MILKILWFTICVSIFTTRILADGPSYCRFYLAGQHDWQAKLGFYLDFEGGKLADLPVILGVADGTRWRFIIYRPRFVTNRNYQIRAIISPKRSELFIDGARIGESPGGWKSSMTTFEVNYRPSWASKVGDWICVVHKIDVTIARDSGDVTHKEFDFTKATARSTPLLLFEPMQPAASKLEIRPSDTMTIDLSLHFIASDLRRWAPFIDRYGQCRYAKFSGKVKNDEELRADIAAEDAELTKMPPSPDFDEYGGYLKAEWHERPTGFFRVVRRDGYWWLITPTGRPCFYLGVSAAPALTWETTPVSGREFLFEWLPPREGLWSAAWARNHWGIKDGTEYVCYHTCNLIRKYGDDWSKKATDRAIRRLKAWGFNGGGKWSAPQGLIETPVLGSPGVPKLARHPDIFDPAVCNTFRKVLERQIAPRRDDPLVLGWSLGSEYSEIITRGEVEKILTMPAKIPAKRAFVDFALDNLYDGSLQKLAKAWKVKVGNRSNLYAAKSSLPDEDIEKLRRFYADRYYGFVYETVKDIDPNHLYLGFWIVPTWWENEEDWRLIAKHCDVISYDRYAREYIDELLSRLQADTDKPTLCGEFSLPAWYDGQRGFGHFHCWANDDEESGKLYYQWVQAAAHDPYCVGLIWFMYRDQPLTGRGPGHGESLVIGEHYSFGLITETDRPKWQMVRKMREANLRAAYWRLKGAQ